MGARPQRLPRGGANMLPAARVGLGATLTTLYLNFEKEVEAALGLPADMHSLRFCRYPLKSAQGVVPSGPALQWLTP